jgi:pimeloyl-ACP methyl ester carboxylesterase
MTEPAWVSGGASPDPAARETTVTAPDGRTLGVAEYGPPDGFPVFSLHGTPGCRYGGPPVDHPDLFEQRSVRVVGYDRPGYGRSTRMPQRTVADAAADVGLIADALGIERFAVSGGSGGGPHCLSVAALLGDRVTRAACVVGVAPYGEPGLDQREWLDGMTQGNVDEFLPSLEGEAALRPRVQVLAAEALAAAATDPARIIGPQYELSDDDRATLADPRRLDRHARNIREALRTGVDGWLDDDLVMVRPWGFDVGDLSVPTMVWFGLDDRLVGRTHGEWLAAHVPGAYVVRMSGGHTSLAHRVPELYSWLVDGTVPPDATRG